MVCSINCPIGVWFGCVAIWVCWESCYGWGYRNFFVFGRV